MQSMAPSLAAALLALVLAVAGCERTPGSDPTESAPAAGSSSGAAKTIGVTLLTLSHDFFKDLEGGMRAAADEFGYRLVIQAAEFDPAVQTRQLEDFVTRRVDAIVVCPCDSDAVATSLKRVEQAGIPVFTADIAAHGARVVSHIASDNVQGGRLAAQALIEHLPGGGKILIIDHPSVSSVQDRTRGFREELAHHTGYEIVATLSSEGQRARAQAVMEDALTRHPDLRGVFGINDDSALGALRAVEAARRTDLVIIGYDATPEARAAIRRGSALKADVVQDPAAIGRMAIDAIRRHFAGEALPARIPVPVGTVDRVRLEGTP